MTVSHTILFALIGKQVSFNEAVLDQIHNVTGVVQGISIWNSGEIEFFVNDDTYSFKNFTGTDFQIL